jgi:hypothetical protein
VGGREWVQSGGAGLVQDASGNHIGSQSPSGREIDCAGGIDALAGFEARVKTARLRQAVRPSRPSRQLISRTVLLARRDSQKSSVHRQAGRHTISRRPTFVELRSNCPPWVAERDRLECREGQGDERRSGKRGSQASTAEGQGRSEQAGSRHQWKQEDRIQRKSKSGTRVRQSKGFAEARLY